jgi:hypothetical protein
MFRSKTKLGLLGFALTALELFTRTQLLKKQAKMNELLIMENELLYRFVEGSNDPDTDPEEFQEEMDERLEFIRMVKEL